VIYTTFASGEAETTFSGADAEVSDEGMADRLPPHYREGQLLGLYALSSTKDSSMINFIHERSPYRAAVKNCR